MPEKIIMIKGVACLFNMPRILEETGAHNQRLATLRRAGHEVTNVGESWKGFYRHSLRRAFEKTPDASIVIANIHGNIKKGKHFLAARDKESSTLWAADFYKDLALFSGNRPLDIFMFSCGSGNGLQDAVEFLPAGSTVVSVVRTDAVSSYVPNAKFLDAIKASKASVSEGLFFNLLSQGYEETRYHPNLSVSTPQKTKYDFNWYDPSWDMWDIARLAMCSDKLLAPDFEEPAIDYLADFFGKDTLSKALETIRLYAHVKNKPAIEESSEKTPIKIRYDIDEYTFEMNTRSKGLFGAMCALGYCAAREEIGAFKAAALRSNTALPCPELTTQLNQSVPALL